MKRKKFEWTGRLILIIFSLILVLSLIFFITKQTHKNTTEQLLTEYMNYINKHEYEKMYKMISKEHSSNISMEEFVKRNKNIYEGLETKDLSIKILNEKSNGKEISYPTSFNTLAGCLLYTSDAADDLLCVDFGGRRHNKKKKKIIKILSHKQRKQ